MLRHLLPALLSALLSAMMAAPAPVRAQEAVMPVQHIPLPGSGPDGTPPLPMAGRTTVWAQRAGLALTWEAVPLKRSLQELARNERPFCVLGLFDTPERRRFARFSLPIHQEEQQVFIAARRAEATLRSLGSAREALLSAPLSLLVYDGVAYGGPLDDWIAQRRPPPVRASAGASRLATMLARGHADFSIGVASELRDLQRQGVADAGDLVSVLLPGMPPPPRRHLACSLKVPPAWLQRFDAQVRASPPP